MKRFIKRSALNIDLNKVAQDPYHRILSLTWTQFFGLALLVFLTINSIFALAYMQDPGGVANIKEGDFLQHFFFSIQTMSTIGYGHFYPVSNFSHTVMTFQVFASIANIALATGIVFAKVSLPSSKIIFSEKILFSQYDKQNSLIFRLANRRNNQIVDAKIHLNIAFDEVTAEGIRIRRFYPLWVKKRHTPLFALSWTIVHQIDASSKLFQKTDEELEQLNAEIYATVVGIDGTFSQKIYASKVYGRGSWEKGGQFEDFLKVDKKGRPILEFEKISSISKA